jgi:hypothetical protein
MVSFMKDMSRLYEKELQEKQKEVIALIKGLAKKDEMMLKNLVAPIYMVEGSAFVDQTQQASWNALVKKYTKVNKNYGGLIDESLRVMRTIELKGIDHAIRELVDLESDVSKVVAVVNKYSKHGSEFTSTLVRNNPKIVEIYPPIARVAKKEPVKASSDRDEYNDKGLTESIEYMSNLIENLNVDERIKEAIALERDELKGIQEKRLGKSKTK